jgi:hypothetical protein
LFIKKFIPCITLLLLVASCIYNPLSEYSTPELVIALQSTDAGERENAARVLETRGRDAKDAIPFLVEALFDSDEHVQIAARDALVSIGPEAVESLFFAIQNGFVKEGKRGKKKRSLMMLVKEYFYSTQTQSQRLLRSIINLR